MAQIRPIVKSIDAAIAQNNEDRVRTEEERGETVKEIGNMLHETCIISNDEVIHNVISQELIILMHRHSILRLPYFAYFFRLKME